MSPGKPHLEQDLMERCSFALRPLPGVRSGWSLERRSNASPR